MGSTHVIDEALEIVEIDIETSFRFGIGTADEEAKLIAVNIDQALMECIVAARILQGDESRTVAAEEVHVIKVRSFWAYH